MPAQTDRPRRPRYDWTAIAAELATNETVRDIAGAARGLERPIYRQQLIAWRKREHDPFPPPAMIVEGGPTPLELWARTDVRDWLSRNV